MAYLACGIQNESIIMIASCVYDGHDQRAKEGAVKRYTLICMASITAATWSDSSKDAVTLLGLPVLLYSCRIWYCRENSSCFKIWNSAEIGSKSLSTLRWVSLQSWWQKNYTKLIELLRRMDSDSHSKEMLHGADSRYTFPRKTESLWAIIITSLRIRLLYI